MVTCGLAVRGIQVPDQLPLFEDDNLSGALPSEKDAITEPVRNGCAQSSTTSAVNATGQAAVNVNWSGAPVIRGNSLVAMQEPSPPEPRLAVGERRGGANTKRIAISRMLPLEKMSVTPPRYLPGLS